MNITEGTSRIYLWLVILFSVVVLSVGLVVYNKFLVVLNRPGAADFGPFKYVGYYYAGTTPLTGSGVNPNINDTAAYTNLGFAANTQEVAALRARGVKAIFNISFWPTVSSRLNSNWLSQWQAIREAIRPQVNDGSIWGVYIWDEPYSHGPAGFENDWDGAELFRKAELEQVIAQIKTDFPGIKTMITNSCLRGHTFPNGDSAFVGDLPLTPPPHNLDVFSIDCYGNPALFEERYNEIKAYNKDIIFTVEALSIGATQFSMTPQGQQGWMTRLQRIAGSNPKFIGVLWFLWPDCPACSGNLGGVASHPDVKAYHAEVGHQVLCSNTWESNPVCGVNGVAYSNPDQAKCANTGIASYGNLCRSTPLPQPTPSFSPGPLKTSVSSADLYSKVCKLVVAPSDNYSALIANLTSTSFTQIVCFRPGTYTSELLIQNKQNLVLIAPEGGVTIQTTTLSTSIPQAPLDIRDSSNIFISGLRIINQHTFSGLTSATQWSNGLYMLRSNNVTVSNSEIQTNGKNSILAIYSSKIQLLNVSSKCWYFCFASTGAPGAPIEVYAKDSYFEADAGRPESHTLFWAAYSTWLFEDTTLKQMTGEGLISGGSSDGTVNITLRGITQSTLKTGWIARHHNYFGLTVRLEGQYQNLDDYVTYGCDWETNDCNDYPNSIADRFQVIRAVGNTPTQGYVDAINSDGVMTGWARDSDLSGSIDVGVVFDGPSGLGTPFRKRANLQRPDLGSYGFEYLIPAQYKDCKPHAVYVYAVGDRAPHTQLRQSPALYYSCIQASPSPMPSPTPTTEPLTCTPRFQTVHVGQEATLTASGGTGNTDYFWITPGNTQGHLTNGSTVRTRYATRILNSRRVTLVRGTQQRHCVVYVVP